MSTEQPGKAPAESSKLDWDTLDRYLAGECNQDEHVIISNRLAGSAESEILSGFVERVAGEPAPPVDAERAWAQFVADERVLEGDLRNRYAGKTLRRWVGYTGTAVVLAVAIAGAKYIGHHTTSGATRPHTYSTAPGQRANITLADGSRITLAPATKLSVDRRTITLQGEATFVVRSDEAAPFIVKTNDADTRVLGTTFSVRRYNDDTRTLVVVAEGKVGAQSLILSAGEGAYIAGGSTLRLTDSEVMRSLARTSGKLIFEGEPVGTVISELSKWYNVKFEGTENLQLGRRITMTFSESSLSLENLAILGSVLGKELALYGNVVRITHR